MIKLILIVSANSKHHQRCLVLIQQKSTSPTSALPPPFLYTLHYLFIKLRSPPVTTQHSCTQIFNVDIAYVMIIQHLSIYYIRAIYVAAARVFPPQSSSYRSLEYNVQVQVCARYSVNECMVYRYIKLEFCMQLIL